MSQCNELVLVYASSIKVVKCLLVSYAMSYHLILIF